MIEVVTATTSNIKDYIIDQKDNILNLRPLDINILNNFGPITPQSVLKILWNNPQILPEGIRNRLMKDVQILVLVMAGNISTGIGANIYLPKMYPSYRQLSLIGKISLRGTVFALPFVFTYPLLRQRYKDYISLVNLIQGTMNRLNSISDFGTKKVQQILALNPLNKLIK